MSDQLRERLREEMSGQQRPQMGGVVEAAVQRGSRARQVRRAASGVGTLAVVSAAVGVLVLSGQAAPGHSTTSAAAAGGTVTVAPLVVVKAVPTVSPAAKPVQKPVAVAPAAKPTPTMGQLASPPPGVPATPAGMVQLLTESLPAGATSDHYGRSIDGSAMIEAYVNAGHGTGMVRLALWKNWGADSMCIAGDTCYKTPAGDLVDIGGLADNCIQTRFVRVVHPDGNGIDINVASCLEWDGTTNQAAPLALTTAEAVALGSDPSWDISMDPVLVSAGAAHFPSLQTFE
jgi:hypothetical protein